MVFYIPKKNKNFIKYDGKFLTKISSNFFFFFIRNKFSILKIKYKFDCLTNVFNDSITLNYLYDNLKFLSIIKLLISKKLYQYLYIQNIKKYIYFSNYKEKLFIFNLKKKKLLKKKIFHSLYIFFNNRIILKNNQNKNLKLTNSKINNYFNYGVKNYLNFKKNVRVSAVLKKQKQKYIKNLLKRKLSYKKHKFSFDKLNKKQKKKFLKKRKHKFKHLKKKKKFFKYLIKQQKYKKWIIKQIKYKKQFLNCLKKKLNLTSLKIPTFGLKHNKLYFLKKKTGLTFLVNGVFSYMPISLSNIIKKLILIKKNKRFFIKLKKHSIIFNKKFIKRDNYFIYINKIILRIFFYTNFLLYFFYKKIFLSLKNFNFFKRKKIKIKKKLKRYLNLLKRLLNIYCFFLIKKKKASNTYEHSYFIKYLLLYNYSIYNYKLIKKQLLKTQINLNISNFNLYNTVLYKLKYLTLNLNIYQNYDYNLSIQNLLLFTFNKNKIKFYFNLYKLGFKFLTFLKKNYLKIKKNNYIYKLKNNFLNVTNNTIFNLYNNYYINYNIVSQLNFYLNKIKSINFLKNKTYNLFYLNKNLNKIRKINGYLL